MLSNKKIESRQRPDPRIKPNCYLKGYLYSTTFAKSCQRKKPDDSRRLVFRTKFKTKLMLQQLYSNIFQKICQRKKSDYSHPTFFQERYIHEHIPTHIYSLPRNRNLVNENHCLRK